MTPLLPNLSLGGIISNRTSNLCQLISSLVILWASSGMQIVEQTDKKKINEQQRGNKFYSHSTAW